ncbi:MAG TPA: histidine--tRNA ligase [Candidatus Sulfotelmatobacter sp.]|nr:histidine--tRNA ligase [Candidatus Sulfotelmatobacter sp.]
MTKLNLAPPSGTRDFLPQDVLFRRRVLLAAQTVFERHGFLPMETPAFERLETLTGKYGDEGEKLIFKILKRGDKAASGESDLALRYDLTVPTMRVVSHYRHVLPRIFKRYQIGPVWRADRPGKGRFREFYQCDVDVVGSASTLADVEVLLALAGVLREVEFPGFVIRLNSRPVLKAMLDSYEVPAERQGAAVVALDKLDKIGVAALEGELAEAGLPSAVAQRLHGDIAAGDFAAQLQQRLSRTEAGRAGLAQIAEIREAVGPELAGGTVEFDPLLARGMDYYTGPIFEFYATEFRSAIAGGGRYDGLSAMFGRKAEPVTGGSLGIERIIMLLQGEDAPPPAGPLAYVTVWSPERRGDALRLAAAIRARGLSAELDLVGGGIGQQLKMASERRCRFAILQGPDEAAAGTVQIKDMDTGAQVAAPVADAPTLIERMASGAA